MNSNLIEFLDLHKCQLLMNYYRYIENQANMLLKYHKHHSGKWKLSLWSFNRSEKLKLNSFASSCLKCSKNSFMTLPRMKTTKVRTMFTFCLRQLLFHWNSCAAIRLRWWSCNKTWVRAWTSLFSTIKLNLWGMPSKSMLYSLQVQVKTTKSSKCWWAQFAKQRKLEQGHEVFDSISWPVLDLNDLQIPRLHETILPTDWRNCYSLARYWN